MKQLHLFGLFCLLVSTGFSSLFAQAPSFDRSNSYLRRYLYDLPHYQPVIFRLSSPAFDSEAYESLELTVEGLPDGLSVQKSETQAAVIVVGSPTQLGEFNDVKITATNQYGSSSLFSYEPRVYPRIPELPESWFPEGIYRQGGELDSLDVPDGYNRYNNKKEWTIEGLPNGIEYYIGGGRSLSFAGKLSMAGEFPVRVSLETDYGTASRDYVLSVASNKPRLASLHGDVVEVDVGESVFITVETSVEQRAGAAARWTIDGLPQGVTYTGHEYQLDIRGASSQSGHYVLNITAENDFGSNSIQVDLYVGITAPAEPTTPSPSEPRDLIFSEGYTRFADTFAYSDWLGLIFDANFPWIYNFEQGWLYVWEETTNQDDIWFYHFGPPSKGWMYSGRDLGGFFYYEVTPGVWSWQWVYTGTFDPDAPGDVPPANP